MLLSLVAQRKNWSNLQKLLSIGCYFQLYLWGNFKLPHPVFQLTESWIFQNDVLKRYPMQDV